MKLLHVVGARPNFPKLAPVHRAAEAAGYDQCVVHTGQHYDDALSASFFRDLSLRPPDVNLEVGSLSHAVQVARIMERFEPALERYAPDWVVVYGDVNSTAAAALVASKMNVRVAHVEAGLRSYDRTMPEEINRIVTDRLADLLLVPSRDAVETLRAEGEPDEEIEFVGNVMIDSLFFALDAARRTGFRVSTPASQRCRERGQPRAPRGNRERTRPAGRARARGVRGSPAHDATVGGRGTLARQDEAPRASAVSENVESRGRGARGHRRCPIRNVSVIVDPVSDLPVFSGVFR